MVGKGGADQEIELFVEFTGSNAGQLVAVSASDSTGTKLGVRRVEIKHNQIALGMPTFAPREVVAVSLPRPYLDSRKTAGLDIQIRGYNNATSVVKVPPAYVAAFVQKLDGTIAEQAK